jgi:flavin reductase (DIM6/NTAB) family NADH-FMN oxidoreductase RutF
MELDLAIFYRILAPRPTVLVSTIDKKGRSNAAPFSFVMPVSVQPPYLAIASVPTRHTLANIRETGEFVVNLPTEEILDAVWTCSKAFPKGVSEIEQSGLSARPSKKIKAPGITECYGWFECALVDEKEAGDHVVVIGEVVLAEVKDEYFQDRKFKVAEARMPLHVGGTDFALIEKIIRPTRD